jgi:hypothetical protein
MIKFISRFEVFTAVIMSSGILCRVDLVRTGVSGELSAFFIRGTRMFELGTTLAVTSNRRKLRRNTKWWRYSYFTDSCYTYAGGAKFLRNVGSYKSYTAQHPRRQHSSNLFPLAQNISGI